jgi:hypothetical protein
MVTLTDLLLPILLSAVVVFIASSIIHMVLPYHSNDFRKMPKEQEAMDALRPLNIPPGDYVFPYAGSMKASQDPAYVERIKAGPVGFVTVLPNGQIKMGASLVLWFLFSIVVSIIAAYIAGSALRRGATYLEVFRFAGCVAFTGYSIALLHDSIWYKRNWGMTLKYMFDGLVYGLLTAGVFGWLWPR